MRVLITDDGRICRKCETAKPWSEFYRKVNGYHGYDSSCKACRVRYDGTRREERRAWDRQYRRSNPTREYGYNIKSRFGLTLDEYDAMLAAQNGLCAACGGPEEATYRGRVRRLSIDHDHKTGEVRGLVCNSCNRAIGYAQDNADRLEACAAYLRGRSCAY